MVVETIAIAYPHLSMKMRIYMDVCCLNRPFDDQAQERIHMESEGIIAILACVQRREHALISSEALLVEIAQNPNVERRQKVRDTLRLATYHIRVGEREADRARELGRHGFGAYDALHVVCAEKAKADILLTTDDLFVRMAQRCGAVEIRICNPLQWIAEGGL